MGTTTLTYAVSGPGMHPAARLGRPIRRAAAAALVLGAGLQAAAWLTYAEPDLVAAYTQIWHGAVRPDVSLTLNVLSIPFWIASVAVYVMLGRTRSPGIAWIGGSLLVGGLAALAANLGTEATTSALVGDHVITPAAAASATLALDTLPSTAFNLLFLVGVGLGIPLTGVSLWRSRAVPREAASLLVAFLVIGMVGQGTGLAAFAIAAQVARVASATWIAVTLLRVESSDAVESPGS